MRGAVSGAAFVDSEFLWFARNAKYTREAVLLHAHVFAEDPGAGVFMWKADAEELE